MSKKKTKQPNQEKIAPPEGAMREKWWYECEVGEKLERCRVFIKMQSREIQQLREALALLATEFDSHLHHNDKIVYDSKKELRTPTMPTGGNRALAGSLNENRGAEVYF